jgi:hypothetical protein
LCESDLAEPENGETKSEWLKRDCFHIVAVTLPRFSILRYQIITRSLRIGLVFLFGVQCPKSVATNRIPTTAMSLSQPEK